MSRKMKLVLKSLANDAFYDGDFEIVKTVNTLSHGVPGEKLERKTVDRILASQDIHRGVLTVEIITK